jgi:amidase
MGALRLVVTACVLVGCGGGGGDDEPPPDAPDVVEMPELDLDLREQVARMETGMLTSADLTNGYFGRIERRDAPTTGTHAFITLDLNARNVAATVDGMRGGGKLLQGAVIVLKDNIDTAGLATTAGSRALAQNVPSTDATLVAKLRAANAVILGKGNLSEWANFRGNMSTSGWSSLGDQTRHPLVKSFSPCGSSSGSAAAVRDGTISAAIGTETNGSIICPSSINGIVGFKPTVGLVSRAGIIPISSTQDTAGPMAKTVGDVARLLRVIAGPDAADPATNAIPMNMSFDFEAGLASASLAGKRLGVVRSIPFDSGTNAVFEMQLQRIAAAGAILVDVSLPDVSTFGADEFTLLTFEFKDGINAYLTSHARPNQPASLADLINYNNANSNVVLRYFGQELFIQSEATTGLATQAYIDAKQRARMATLDNGILAVMAANNLDALISPSTGPSWVINYQTGDTGTQVASAHAAIAGCPHLTIPMGAVMGMPVGLSLVARPFEDAKVIELGYAYEQLRGPVSARVETTVPLAQPPLTARDMAGM